MAKTRVRTLFVCQQCGGESPKWLGRCPNCLAWNSLVETREATNAGAGSGSTGLGALVPRGEPLPLPKIALDQTPRLSVPTEEFNRVLGGGIVPGSIVLIGGDPGIGKSTLLLQISAQVAGQTGRVLYVSGEESPQQIKLRADRMGIPGDDLLVLSETSLTEILNQIERLRPDLGLVVVDSIQTVYMEDLQSAAGSVAQVRDCAVALQRLAKQTHVPVFLVGHVTKEGTIAGPRVLEHIVDTVLYLEGERFHSYRLLRAVKNRFGSTNEVGVFEMSEQGMREVLNPSAAFLGERAPGTTGAAIAATLEGTRPLLVEIQALTSATSFGTPRRTTNGMDLNRLHMLTAVLSKRLGMQLGNQDIIVNVVGGLKVTEPAADLAAVSAVASSYRERPVAADLAIVGEVGLGGELRTVGQLERRLAEAAKLGFTRGLVPWTGARARPRTAEVKLEVARSLGEALEIALE